MTMKVNNDKLHSIYHEVEYLIQHLSDLRYTMVNTIDDIRQIKDRLDDMIADSKEKEEEDNNNNE